MLWYQNNIKWYHPNSMKLTASSADMEGWRGMNKAERSVCILSLSMMIYEK